MIILIVLIGMHSQFAYANFTINGRTSSYLPVKESGLWMKDNSNPGDTIISASVTQHSYYSERQVHGFYFNGTNQNETIFLQEISKLKPKYFVVSIFEPGFQPDWALTFQQRYQDIVFPVQVYTLNPQTSNPSLVIFEFNPEYFKDSE